jgi:hypothetical protein
MLPSKAQRCGLFEPGVGPGGLVAYSTDWSSRRFNYSVAFSRVRVQFLKSFVIELINYLELRKSA